jgi:signal transduction histidine kinase
MSPVSSRWTARVRRHPFATDVLIAVVVAVTSLVGHFSLRDPSVTEPSVWTIALIVGTSAALLARRRWPVSTLILVQVGESLQGWFYIIGTTTTALLIGAYSVGRYSTRRRLLVAAVVSLVGLIALQTVALVTNYSDGQSYLYLYLYLLVPHTAAFVLGNSVRLNHERAAQLQARAERAEREQELLAQQQLQSERTRIARELHDVVAHGVSTMVIHATAARRHIPTDPGRAAEAMGTVEEVGRRAMNEMRQLLGVLRSDEGTERGPQPQLDDLRQLVDTMPELRVQLAVPPLTAVPQAVSLNAYRVVQEALVNASRHAGPGTHVVVSLAVDDDQLQVTVVDDGLGTSVSSLPSSGFGIVGMRERVNVHGGSLSAGPGTHGGWKVFATFPFATATAGVDSVGQPS